jgi:regulator of sigma E protease
MLLEVLSNPIVAMILLLGALVFFHELGHYLVAKFCGVGVETFSIGFGPKLFSFKYHDTVYQIAAIPLGGFVKLAGAVSTEDIPKKFRGKEFYKSSLWARAAILFAGPLANFILAAAIHSVFASSGIEHIAAVVGSVRKESPALKSGLEPGDKIIKIASKTITKWSEMQAIVSASANKPLVMQVERKDKILTLNITPQASGTKQSWNPNSNGRGQIGVGFGEIAPVLTVLSPKSKAYFHGFRTGDLLKEVRYQSSKVEIKTWGDFTKTLQEVSKQNDLVVSFVIERILSKKSSDKVILEVNSNNFKLFKDQDYFKVKSLLRNNFGIVDSELTIESVGEKLQKHLQQNDVVLYLNSLAINDIYDLSKFFRTNNKPFANVTISRQGQTITKEIPLKAVEQQEPEGKRIYYVLDAQFVPKRIYPDPVVERYDSYAEALVYGVSKTKEQSAMILKSLVDLFSGSLSVKSLGGPIMIAKVAGDSVKAGWEVFFATMAIISVNLGVVNLFPIPVLDGGQLVLVFCEALRRKPLSIAFVENFQKLGFVMLLSLIILSTYNDLSRFWSSILQGVIGN